MGKRKTKSSQLKRQSPETSSSSSDIYDSPEFHHTSFTEDNSYILTEVQDSLTDIYREYLRDLKTRKQKRLELKNPTSETQLYNLVINPKYRSTMKAKIRTLLHLDCICNLKSHLPESSQIPQKFCSSIFQNGYLKNIIDDTLEVFLSALKDFLKDAEDKSRLLQLVYLHEVYHTMQNSIGEISRIVNDLYPSDEFNKMSLTKFYNTILISNKKLLNYAKTQDSTHYAVGSVMKMYEDVEFMVKTGKYRQKEVLMEVCSENDEVSEEPVHSLPLEDLVNYINGPTITEKCKSKIKRQTEFVEMDDEISEFENRLANARPLEEKSAPCCSVDFLKALKDRYLEVRRKLLNN